VIQVKNNLIDTDNKYYVTGERGTQLWVLSIFSVGDAIGAFAKYSFPDGVSLGNVFKGLGVLVENCTNTYKIINISFSLYSE